MTVSQIDNYSSTVEDYLKAILDILRTRGVDLAPMGLLAEELSLTPGTITTMVRRLTSDGLVVYEPRKGCGLTPKGRKIALRTLRRHRVLETFLVKTLGMDWSSVHDEAENMEHGVSDDVINRLWEYLGCPTEDPHGGPIPGPNLKWPAATDELTLDQLPFNCDILLTRIPDRSAELLRSLEAVDIGPGKIFQIEEYQGTGVVMLSSPRGKVPVANNIARIIWGRAV